MDAGRVAALVSQLTPIVTALHEQVTGQAAANVPNDPWRLETGFPKVKEFDGVKVMCVGPMNPQWMPTAMAHVLGSQGSEVFDPSYPAGARSPAGFPMYHGQILWYDAQYPSDDQVLTAISTWTNTPALVAADQANTAANENELQPGQLDMRTWSVEDLLFYHAFDGELQGVGGPRIEERRFDNGAAMGTLDDFSNPNMQAVLDILAKVKNGQASYDWTAYHGPLRQKLADHRGLASI